MSLRHWIWLTLEFPQAARSVALLDALESPERIYTADRAALASTGLLKSEEIDRLLASRSLEKAQAVLLRTAQLGIQVLTLRDAAYPDRLRNITNPPPVLYCKGTLPLMDDHVCLAVVGTRKASPRACRMTESFAYDLARAGIIIVSGMASGIDSQGHLGALRAGMPTVAVFGCGLDTCYPAENRVLMEEIIANGCILSEYPPGTPPAKRTFPERNRIISGLSMGVLVGAAPRRSGSLITAHHALEQGRDVFVIPGGLGDPEFEGSNEYIKEGAAMVTSAEDILREYLERWPELIRPPVSTQAPEPPRPPRMVAAQPRQEPQPPVPAPPIHTEKRGWKPQPIWESARSIFKRRPEAQDDQMPPDTQTDPVSEQVQAPADTSVQTPAPAGASAQADKPVQAPVRAPSGKLSTRVCPLRPYVEGDPAFEAMSEQDRSILAAVSSGAQDLEAIADATGLSADIVVAQLMFLAIEGFVAHESVGG